jgi:hypothetical protein
MKWFISRITFLSLLAFLCVSVAGSQEQKGKEKTGLSENIIRDIESGILQNDVKSFSRYFDKNIYITLRDGETGYFSANQAVYVLQNYFESHRFLRFSFSTVNLTDVPLYATGGGTYLAKGSQANVQVYITVSHTRGGYVITQFCVY